MSIRRGNIPATDNFTIVPNDWARDAVLSWRARGLLTYLLSHREGWHVSIRHLAAVGPDGRDAVAKGLSELVDRGYLKREQQREGGRISGVEYEVTGLPMADSPRPENPDTVTGKLSTGADAALGQAAEHEVAAEPTNGDTSEQGPWRNHRVRENRTRENRVRQTRTHKKNISSEDQSGEDQHPSSSPAAAPRPDVESLCEHLADRIEANGSKRPAVTKAWRDEARRLLDLDGIEASKAHNLIDWCQADPFWRSVVLSMPKFREKYEQLRLKALQQYEEQRKGQQRPNGRPTPMERVANIAAIAQEMQAEQDARAAGPRHQALEVER